MRGKVRDKDECASAFVCSATIRISYPSTVHHDDEEGQKSIYQRLVYRNLFVSKNDDSKDRYPRLSKIVSSYLLYLL